MEDLKKISLSLQKGILQAVGPASVITSLKELPLRDINVFGFRGCVAGEEPPKVEVKKGLGRKKGAPKTKAKAKAETLAPAEPTDTSGQIAQRASTESIDMDGKAVELGERTQAADAESASASVGA